MQKQIYQMQWKVRGLHIVRVVGMVMLCFAALALTTFHSHVHAVSNSGTGSAASGPSSGPVGTTISVSGTGWPEADGTQASFGYMVNPNPNCNIVRDSQNGILHGGSFNGWFRWPTGTTPGTTYTVCVMVAGATAIAGSFTVLSSMPPQVSISPSTLVEKQSATITATNYFPQGTTVNFSWVSQSNQVEFGIPGTTSDSNGTVIVNFIMPVTSMPGGTYMIEATAGNPQQPTLFSSVNVTYNAPVVQPSPTPKATPSPTPTSASSPTPASLVDPTPAISPTVQASVTPAAGATLTPVVTQNPGGNSTPTTNSNILSISSNRNTTNSPDMLLLVGGVVGALVLLISILIIVLIARRKRARRIAMLTEAGLMPPSMPASAGATPWSTSQGVFMNNGSIPANGINANPAWSRQGPTTPMPPINNVPTLADMSMQIASPATNLPPAGPPPLLPSQNLPVLSSAQINPGSDGNSMIPISLDPTLEAMRRQAQTGLFAPPRPRLDEITVK